MCVTLRLTGRIRVHLALPSCKERPKVGSVFTVALFSLSLRWQGMVECDIGALHTVMENIGAPFTFMKISGATCTLKKWVCLVLRWRI